MRDSARPEDSKEGDRELLAAATDEGLAGRLRVAAAASPAVMAAATELFERYKDRVYLWCLRRVGERELALDLAQDVLITAYRAVGSFRGQCRYSTWLFTITRNRCSRALRRPSLVRDEETELDDLQSPDDDPAIRLEEEEGEQVILDLVNRVLDPDERLAIWLRCCEGLPIDEVTRRLDHPPPTGARSVLQNARRKLRAALEERDRSERKRMP